MERLNNTLLMVDIYHIETGEEKHYILNGTTVDKVIARHIEMYGDDIEDISITFRRVTNNI